MSIFPAVNGQGRSLTEQLSAREREVFFLLLAGLGTVEIAKRLSLAPTTVSTHKTKLFERFHVASEVQLALLAAADGLIDMHGAHQHLQSLQQLQAA